MLSCCCGCCGLLHQPPAGRITSPHRAPAGYLHGNRGALSISGASEVTTLRRCTNLLIITTLIIFLSSVAYDPQGRQKLDRLQNTTKLAGMTCHLINKAVMKQNCIEALNQHAQPLENKAAVSRFTVDQDH